MLYDKEPILVLWDLVKGLANTIPIYKYSMVEDEDSIPDSYILLTDGTGGGDSGRVYGDGATILRGSSSQINLISKGPHSNSTDTHNVNVKLIKNALKDVPYNYINLGFNGNVTESVFTLNINYKE